MKMVTKYKLCRKALNMAKKDSNEILPCPTLEIDFP
jgi:hypothetical protein